VAAIAAAQAIREQDAQGKILVISDDPAGYYSRPGLAYYLTGELDEKQLFPLKAEEFCYLEIQQVHARVTKIDPQMHQVSLNNQQTIQYDRLLIATGAQSAALQIPNSDLSGVVKLDNLEDARAILKLARRNRTAVVIGGGITALEIADGLLARGVKTHYFIRGERYWSNVLDASEAQIVERRLKEHGLIIHRRTEITEILNHGHRLGGVRTVNGEVIPCTILAVAIGVLPRIRLAQAAGIQVDRGILVDELMQTSVADIFAAGDVVQVYDPATGRTVLDSLWTPARQQGQIAGLNMAGGCQRYRKAMPFNVTRLADITTTIIGTVGKGNDADLVGIARGDSETWRDATDAITAQVEHQVNHLRIMVGEQTLLGAVIMGDQSLSRPLYQVIAKQEDITSIRHQLLQPEAPIAKILGAFCTGYKRDHDRPTQ
jgi:NADPH-dependent 2,4-dienoyl-CoA reductase/sulfur reductase-like enzyme